MDLILLIYSANEKNEIKSLTNTVIMLFFTVFEVNISMSASNCSVCSGTYIEKQL